MGTRVVVAVTFGDDSFFLSRLVTIHACFAVTIGRLPFAVVPRRQSLSGNKHVPRENGVQSLVFQKENAANAAGVVHAFPLIEFLKWCKPGFRENDQADVEMARKTLVTLESRSQHASQRDSCQ